MSAGQSSAQPFVTPMLNMADDDLGPYEYRLLGHYVRRANHSGRIPEGIRDTAAACRMSPDRTRRARAELKRLGYLNFKEPTEDEQQRGIPTVVTLIDRWAENASRYTPVQNSAHPVQEDAQDGDDTRAVSSTPPVQNSAPNEFNSLRESDSAVLESSQGEGIPRARESHSAQPPPQNIVPFPEPTDLVTLWQHPFVQAWWNAIPPDKRVIGIDAQTARHVRDLEALGASLDEIAGLVASKFERHRNEYRFVWLVQDLPVYREQKRVADTPPAPTGIWAERLEPEPDRGPELTPEERLALAEEGRRLYQQLQREMAHRSIAMREGA